MTYLDIYYASLTQRQIDYLEGNNISGSMYRKLGSIVLGEYNEELVLKHAAEFIKALEAVTDSDLSSAISEVKGFIEKKELVYIISYFDFFKRIYTPSESP